MFEETAMICFGDQESYPHGPCMRPATELRKIEGLHFSFCPEHARKIDEENRKTQVQANIVN